MSGAVTDVTDNNFQAEVIESEVPVLVDFWAPWCGPCRRVSPVVEEIASERGEALKVVKLNIDENQQTAVKFNVMSIPTLMLFRHGEVKKTVIGAYPKRSSRRSSSRRWPRPARSPDCHSDRCGIRPWSAEAGRRRSSAAARRSHAARAVQTTRN